MIVLVILLLVAAVYYLFFSPSSQVFGAFPFRLKTEEKIVALTFDDGPNEPYTGQIANVLAKHQVKATFFAVGVNAAKSPESVRRLVKDGHSVGLHSMHHSFAKLVLARNIDAELDEATEAIEPLLGRKARFYRPPWLFRHPALFRVLKEHGLQPVSGEFINPWEIFQPKPERMAKSAVRKAKPGTILIFHDGYNAKGGSRNSTVEALEQIIAELKKRGFSFVTIDEAYAKLSRLQ